VSGSSIQPISDEDYRLDRTHHAAAADLLGGLVACSCEFAIEPVSRGVSRLTRRTWYAHDLYPSAYWRIWCDMGASNIQRFVLDEVKRAAEHA